MLIACLATLKLAPRLPTKVALAQFPDVQHAVDAVQEILRTPYGNNIRMHRVDFDKPPTLLTSFFTECVELVDDYSMPLNSGIFICPDLYVSDSYDVD